MTLAAAFHKDNGTRDLPGQDSPWDTWVAASRTYNFCSDDPLLDWLSAFGQLKGYQPDDALAGYDARTDFRKFLTAKAIEFESAVVNYLAERFQLVRIPSGPGSARSRMAVESTWAAMYGALLARQLGADLLLLLTDVEGVCLDFGTPRARSIARTDSDVLTAHQFAAGSMGPKVEAAAHFAAATGRPAAIGRQEDAARIVRGEAGTQIVAGRSEIVIRDPSREGR